VKLSPKQRLFIKHYRLNHNGKQAAIAAGYTKRSAEVTASRLLRNAKVAAELGEQQKQLEEKLEVSVEWVVKRLMRRADFDVRKFYREDGSLRPIAELDEETAYALQGLEIEKLYEHFGKGQAAATGTLTKIKFADRDRALELLGRHLKMFTDKVEITGADALVARLQAARKRVSA